MRLACGAGQEPDALNVRPTLLIPVPREHLQTYLTALKLLVALVIKINDEFCLLATDKVSS